MYARQARPVLRWSELVLPAVLPPARALAPQRDMYLIRTDEGLPVVRPPMPYVEASQESGSGGRAYHCTSPAVFLLFYQDPCVKEPKDCGVR
jgi:hypothetical protein